MILRTVMVSLLNVGEVFYRFAIRLWTERTRDPERQKRVSARVISVGNITWGGTGKTPIVMMLARALSARGKRVAVLTRGYGQDEAFELKSALAGIPILVGRDRRKTAEEAIARHQAEILILDDGFQHRRLGRDCDVVAVNATNPFGNGHLVPRGILREPVESLGRADVLVVTKAALGRQNVNLIRQRLRELNSRAAIFEANHEPVRFLDPERNQTQELVAVMKRRVALLTGIEDPTSFERIIARLGAQVVFAARFNDHHAFTPGELKQVFESSRRAGAEFLITTAKDNYRLSRVMKRFDAQGIRVLALQIEVQLDDEEDFIRRCADLSRDPVA